MGHCRRTRGGHPSGRPPPSLCGGRNDGPSPMIRDMARNEYLELTDWRRRVAALWQAWRDPGAGSGNPAEATTAFRTAKDELFKRHPQSPLLPGDRASFRGLEYWAYDPAWRMVVPLERDPADAAG